MPNLQQLIELKKSYGKLGRPEVRFRDYLLKKGLENIALTKSFSFSDNAIFENFDISQSKPEIIAYFENIKEEDVVLLFIDIANFSEITVEKSNTFIATYLNNYYKKAMPIIYKYGGQIEKLMGDGIICVFGKPFIDVSWTREFNRAEKCSKELIELFRGTNKEVKIALHSGPIRYFKTPVEYYEEYTMIGKPITELYRLESESVSNALNFYEGSVYDGMNPKTGLGLSSFESSEVKLFKFAASLKGVSYKTIRYLRF